ncbi:hypothetical protein K3495_g11203 [Podosphaera aphanis]|nr:hypothetical protein K3495_g11203 [Podosphaera aphanis]
MNSTSFAGTIPLCKHFNLQFGPPKEIVSDNAGVFQSAEAVEWHKSNGTKIRPITPLRLNGNGRFEQANGKIKAIVIKLIMDQPGRPVQEYFHCAVYIYNRPKGPNGYSPYFLMYGTHPPQEQQICHAYEHESTPEEEKQWSEELVRAQAANTARIDVASMKAAREKRTDSDLYYRGLGSASECGSVQRKLSHSTMGHGQYLLAIQTTCIPSFHRVVYDLQGDTMVHICSLPTRAGHPVRSLWYGSARLLEQDRRRIADAVGGL